MPPCLLFEQDLDVPTPHLPQMFHSCVSNGDARGAQGLQCKKATDLILGWISTTSNSLLWHPDQPALGRQPCPVSPSASPLQAQSYPHGDAPNLNSSPASTPWPEKLRSCQRKSLSSQGTPPAPASHECTGYTRKLTSLHFKLGLLLEGSVLLQ